MIDCKLKTKMRLSETHIIANSEIEIWVIIYIIIGHNCGTYKP